MRLLLGRIALRPEDGRDVVLAQLQGTLYLAGAAWMACRLCL